MFEFCVLGSGSNGNAFYFEADGSALLVDAGLSFRMMKQRLQKYGKSISDVSHVFVTHEHIDHVRGIPQLVKRCNAMVHANISTLRALPMSIHEENIAPLHGPVELGSIVVEHFSKNHDAADPVGFTVRHGDTRVPVITDAGVACSRIVREVTRASALILESNYDEHMLMQGRYPPYLKKRIASDRGHLSNLQAAVLALAHLPPTLSVLYLAHISENNNRPDIAYGTFRQLTQQRRDLVDLDVQISSRHEAMEPYMFE